MNEKQHQSGFGNIVWTFFASINLTIVLLISIAAASIIGTVVPQNGKPDFYFHKYGEVLYRTFSTLDLFDMYQSWWFRFLIILLVVNIIVCSIHKLSATWKIIFPGRPVFRKNKFKRSTPPNEFTAASQPDELVSVFEKTIGRRYRHVTREASENGVLLFAEKGRWTRIGVYAVHLSVVLLLTGGLIGSLFGFDGSVIIAEGEQTNQVLLKDSSTAQPLDFQIRCDDFSVSFYDSGAPKEFRSALTLLKQGKPVVTKDIIVNDPLRFGGINIFQSSYGKLPPRNIVLVFHNRQGGDELIRQTVQIGEKTVLPDNRGEFVLNNYSPQFIFRGRNIGEAFTGTLVQPDAGTVDVVIPYPFPRVDFQNPAELKNLEAFQAGSMGAIPEKVSFLITSKQSEMTYTISLGIGETKTIPEGLGRFTLDRFERTFNFKGHDIGEAFVGTLQAQDGARQEVVLPLRFSQFDRMRGGNAVIAIADLAQESTPSDLIVSVADFQEHFYTGLQVTKDPGVWVVYLGFAMMIIGCYVTFFLSHQQICIETVQKGNQTIVNVMGSANKNQFTAQKKLEALATRLHRSAT